MRQTFVLSGGQSAEVYAPAKGALNFVVYRVDIDHAVKAELKIVREGSDAKLPSAASRLK